jgi:D-alanine transaminase
LPEIAYVNGEFLPLDRAVVHVEDRGFQFGDAVYEVVRTYSGKPFAVEEHLARLLRSMEAIELEHDLTVDGLKILVSEAVRRARFPEAVVYLQITRGHAPRHRGFPSPCKPTVVLTVRELMPLSSELRENGIAVITLPDNRWARCDIKSVALLANVLAYHAAKNDGAHDAIFLEADGAVTEATAGNVFVLTGGRLRTPPKSPKILAGVTREKILETARTVGIDAAEGRVTKTDLLKAEEIFLTSTTAEVVPVVSVDRQPVGDGKPGPMAGRVYEQFVRMFAKA